MHKRSLYRFWPGVNADGWVLIERPHPDAGLHLRVAVADADDHAASSKTSGSNNGAWGGARSLYLSNVNNASQDVSSTFRQMKAGDVIRIEHKTDSTIWSFWTLAVAPIDYATYFTFPVSVNEYHGNPVDNTVYRMVITFGPPTTERLSIGEHLLNLSVIANGMLQQQNISLSSVGDDAIKVYDRLVRSYLETPELPQPLPPPVLPSVKAI